MLALLLLGSLFLWNAPAMALPALLQQLGQCEVAPAKPAVTAPAAMQHMHHPGMHHGGMMMPEMAMPAAPVESASPAQCFSEHTCCTWNREPARKSNSFSLSDAQLESGDVASSSLLVAQPTAISLLPSLVVKPVGEKKADLRI
jgi:hypothetical protein